MKERKKKQGIYTILSNQDPKPPLPVLYLQAFFFTLYNMFWLPFSFIMKIMGLALISGSVGAYFVSDRLSDFGITYDFLPEVMKYAVIIICATVLIYLIFDRKMLIPAVLFFLLTLSVCEIGYDKVRSIYNRYDEEAEKIVQNSDEYDFSISQSSRVYDVNNRLIAVLKENSDLSYLKYEDIPEDVVDAFIAIEDRTFWENDGADYNGMIRVLRDFISSSGDEMHGASTITQQLVRNTYLTREVKIERKIKEILIARHLTEKYSKEQIMEYYVNDVCFANAIYGIAGAARAYFDTTPDRLTLSQTAYLCAIPNRPSYYDPYKNPDNAIPRRDKILRDMYSCGYITRKEMQDALEEKITINRPEEKFNNYSTTFAADSTIQYFMKLGGFTFRYEFDDMDDYDSYHEEYDEIYERERHRLYTGGFTIRTTLDLDIYEKLQDILDKNLEFNQELNEETGIYELQGSISVIDNETGKIVAVVGGRGQEGSTYSFNRAFQGYRQPGSSFKPIAVYTPALMNGFTPDSMVENIDVTAAKDPDTDPQTLHGEKMLLRTAVEKSKNGVAWKLFDKLTPSYGLRFPADMEYSGLCPSDYYDSAALGGLTYGVTTTEQASGYCALANGGIWRKPTCLTSVVNKNGVELYKEYDKKNVYDEKAASEMVDILKGVLTKGTAAGLKWYSSTKTEAFGKTGTTNGSKDGWFCGATPYYSMAVWVGFDTPRELDNLYGATYPGQIWKECMLSLIDGKDTAAFSRSGKEISVAESEGTSETGYYSYLPGRDDAEVLSGGYTVADYRNDRVIGEAVTDIINQINALDMSSPEAGAKLSALYSQGRGIIDTIYSRKYTAEMTGKLESAYGAKSGATAATDTQADTGNAALSVPTSEGTAVPPATEQETNVTIN